MLTISEKAANKVKQIASKQGKADVALRVKVVGGGCSGLSYEYGFAEQVSSADQVIEGFGVKVAIDKQSLIYVTGSVLDYEEGLMKSGFKIKNPNAVASCSCGESFSV